MDTVWSVNFSVNGKNIIIGGVRSDNQYYGIRRRNINMDESTTIHAGYYSTLSYVELLNNDLTLKMVRYEYRNNSPIFLMAGSFLDENILRSTYPVAGREIHHFLSFSVDNRFFAHSDGRNIFLSDGQTGERVQGNHLLHASKGQSSLFSENTSYWYVVNGKQINVLLVDFESIAEAIGMALDTNRLLRGW